MSNKKKPVMFILFLIPLFLPIYHNLFYAGEWRFFVNFVYDEKLLGSVDFFKLPIFNYNNKTQEIIGLNYRLIFGPILHYIGLDIEEGKLNFSLISAIFLPYATFLYFWFIKLLPSPKYRILYLILSLSAITPVIALGQGGYYPRFELINVIVSVVSFLILYIHFQNKNEKYIFSIS
jgi:hypothetical protein